MTAEKKSTLDEAALNRLVDAAIKNIHDELVAIVKIIEITGRFDVRRIDETVFKLQEYKKLSQLKYDSNQEVK